MITQPVVVKELMLKCLQLRERKGQVDCNKAFFLVVTSLCDRRNGPACQSGHAATKIVKRSVAFSP